MSKSKKLNSSRRHKNHIAKGNTPVLIVLGGLALVALALFALWKTGQPQSPRVAVDVEGAPRLQVDREKVDFGEVKVGEWVEVSFQLSNVGDQPLNLTGKPFVEVVEGC